MQPSIRHREAARAMTALCAEGLDSAALRTALAARLRPVVPFDAYCFGTIDPATLLITDEVSEGIPARAFALAAENEYLVDDVHKFGVLARGTHRFGILSEGTDGDPNRSHRYGRVMPMIDARHELRAAFVVAGACWGGITLFRTGARPDFTADDGAVLAALSAPIARGLRSAVRRARMAATGEDPGPGLIVLDADGEVAAINPAGHVWLDELGVPSPRAELRLLPMPVHEVAAAARAAALVGVGAVGVGAVGVGAAGVRSAMAVPPRAHLRLRTARGQWLSLHGSHADGVAGREGRTVIVLEAARSSDLVQLLMLAYGLTERERSVLRLVISGFTSSEMSRALAVSGYTVQDHLKSIFDKVGVRSRGQLVARVLGEHYLPHIGQG